jgi:hypothetical protein
MPKRVAMNISFPTEEEKEAAVEKAKERDTTVSGLVAKYFRKLPRKDK